MLATSFPVSLPLIIKASMILMETLEGENVKHALSFILYVHLWEWEQEPRSNEADLYESSIYKNWNWKLSS